MRIKLIKGSNKGQILNLSEPEALDLIKTGQAILTKDMTSDDYKQAGESNGKLTRLRLN